MSDMRRFSRTAPTSFEAGAKPSSRDADYCIATS
jgi:hypothetical protein